MEPHPRVLAVDDDKLIRMNLALMLGREGLEVDTASTCREATALLGSRAYGVVVTDLDLPDASGLEVVRLAQTLAPGAKVIVVTGSSSTITASEAETAGAQSVLIKPFALADLMQHVRSALGWVSREGKA